MQEGSLCSWSVFVEWGTLCSPRLHWGSKASLGALARVLESSSLWPEMFKKEKAKRKLGWFSVDCAGLPALLGLHSQNHETWK